MARYGDEQTQRSKPPGVAPDRRRGLLAGSGGFTLLIAWRNLVHDRMRLAVTVVGIAFSTILMGMQLGLLLNFLHSTSTVVDHAGADLWIAAHGVRTVDLAIPMGERRRFQALAVPGVALAEPQLLQFAMWKRPDGIRESVILIGVDKDAAMGGPWDLSEGPGWREAVSIPDGVIIDRLYADKLGITALGGTAEINGHRVRVTGFTQGIQTFTQSPYVFTSLRNARAITLLAATDLTYVLIRVAPGFQPAQVAAELARHVPDVDVITSGNFARRSNDYWLFSTGAGISIISSSVLALLVGLAISAQTLYASTVDRLPEYATIRAMGGSRGYLYRIVIKQALLGGLVGYACGISVVLALVHLGGGATAGPEMPPWLAAGIGVVCLAMCVLASLASLKKVTSIDPVAVFR